MNKQERDEVARKSIEMALAPVKEEEEQLPACYYGMAANGAYEALYAWFERVEREGEQCTRRGSRKVLVQVRAAKRLLTGLILVNAWKELAAKGERLPEGDCGEVIGMLAQIGKDAELLGFRWERLEVY